MSMSPLLDFPFFTVSNVSEISKPLGHRSVSSGSNSTGVCLPTGPVFTLQVTRRLCLGGIVVSRLVVLIRQSSSWLRLSKKFTNIKAVWLSRSVKLDLITWDNAASPLLPLIIFSITLKPINGESKHCSVTKNGTFKSGLQDDSLKFSSTQPMYGISLPLAAVMSSLVSSDSDLSLTTTPGKFFKNSLDMIETWAPVF